MMRFAFLKIAIITFFIANPAWGYYCSEPDPPIYTPQKPNVPFCVNEFTNTHTCDEWEINMYYQSLQSYNHEVDSFVQILNEYVDDAAAYAECRIRQLD